jgi:hypothetical protein
MYDHDLQKAEETLQRLKKEISPEHLEKQEADKRKVLFSILLFLVLIQTSFLNVSTFLPIYIDDNHDDIQSFQVGMILS